MDNDDDGDDDNVNNNNNDNDSNGDNNNNNNTTIKQCTEVRERREMVALMDDVRQQKWQLLRRNSIRGIKEEECMTIDNRRLHDE